MNLPINQSNQTIEMSSVDFLDNFINPARIIEGEKPSRNNDFSKRVEDECPELVGYEIFVTAPTGGTPRKTYKLNYDQMILVGMRESKAVRKAVLAKLKELTTPKPMTEIELIANIATSMVRQEKAIEQAQSDVKALGSDVAVIKNKVDKIQDLSTDLKMGYIPIHKGWHKYCNVCSYEVFREFVNIMAVPQEKLTVVPEGTIAIVDTTQIRIADLLKLRDHIVKGAKQKTKHFWEHPDLNHKFKLREL